MKVPVDSIADESSATTTPLAGMIASSLNFITLRQLMGAACVHGVRGTLALSLLSKAVASSTQADPGVGGVCVSATGCREGHGFWHVMRVRTSRQIAARPVHSGFACR